MLKKPKLTKLFLVALLALAVGLFLYFDLGDYVTLEYAQAHRDQLLLWYEKHRLWMLLAFFAAYLVMVAVSFPGATVMTLLGGAIFGFELGLLIASFASTLGAVLAFFIARYLLRDWVQAKFGNRLAKLNDGMEREGGFYLFTLRLVPLFPFFVINTSMGLTNIKAWQFYWVSQLAMLPGTAVYVFAGQELGNLTGLSGIFNARLIAAFALIGLLPLLSKKLISYVQGKKAQTVRL